MGAPKGNVTIGELVEYLEKHNKYPHFSEEGDFLGYSSHWLMKAIEQDHMNLISGKMIGTKTQKNKTILLEDLMEEAFLDLSPECVGVYLPADDILNRTKYQWFAVISSRELLESRIIVAKYLKASMVDQENEYAKERSVVAI
jgi:hypothetical protein